MSLLIDDNCKMAVKEMMAVINDQRESAAQETNDRLTRLEIKLENATGALNAMGTRLEKIMVMLVGNGRPDGSLSYRMHQIQTSLDQHLLETANGESHSFLVRIKNLESWKLEVADRRKKVHATLWELAKPFVADIVKTAVTIMIILAAFTIFGQDVIAPILLKLIGE